MNKVFMIEYQGRCDEQGKAVGHAPKVLKDYYHFIKDTCDVKILAPKTILMELTKEESAGAKVLPERIVMKGKTPLFEKIGNKWNMFSNIRKALRYADSNASKDGETILWFFNVEFYLMLYLFLHRKCKQKIVCTLFLDGYHVSDKEREDKEKLNASGKKLGRKAKLVASVKQWIFEQAQKKMMLIISTGKEFRFKNCPCVFLPDYYDKVELYEPLREKYSAEEKKDVAVCLGTMGNGKQLEEMVEAFARINYPLKVVGRFYDEERVRNLRKMAEGYDITVENRFLSLEEYLNLLAEAKYTILPYAPVNYSRQTSGVMQEAIFLNTVPVTYREILEGNGILGVGFETWDKLTKEMLEESTDSYLKDYAKLRENEYKESRMKEQFALIFGE